MKFVKISIFCIYIILLLNLLPAQAGNVPEKINILVLHSYHEGLPWSKGLARGLDDVFSESELPLVIHVEYLDNIRHRNDDILEDLAVLFKKKFQNISLKAIVLTDDPALSFVLARRESLFPGIPIFFCGPNGLKTDNLKDLKDITGVAENPDMTGTIKLVQDLHPGVTEFAVVSDRNPASLRVLQTLERIEAESNNTVSFRVLTDASLSDLLDELSNLPDDTPVLFHAFLRDARGNTYGSNLTVLETLSGSVKLPFYTFKKIDIGHGALGGSVISEELMASLTGRMALDYLNGIPIHQIQPIIDTPQVFIFDALQLKRFKIPISELPEESNIINQRISFYQANIILVWSVAGVIAILLSLVTFLAMNVKRRHKAEMELKLTNEDLEQRVHDRTEDYKKARLKAEAATRAKSDFLANMSHEIRTPMNAIIGLDSLLAKTEMSKKQRDYVDKIGISSRNLLGIINDILDFSKIEAGKLEIEKTTFELSSVLNNLAGLIGEKAREKGLEFVINQDLNLPDYLSGDPLRLGQVLLNLTNNGIKFTEKGEIVVGVKLFESSDRTMSIRFEVKDTGIGLTGEQLEKMFQSFSQADTSITRKYGGSGLGLSISKKLVKLMGGQIGVESEYGKGSTFYFTLPLDIGDGKKKVKNIAPEELTGINVLVVDDNETARDVLTAYLEDFSFNVKSVPSGDLALRELTQSKADENKEYELVLMDYHMPGMNGIETSRRIREELENVEVPKIVMVTGIGREEIMKQAEAIGLQGFLIKPVSPSMLFDTIMEVFGKSTGLNNRMRNREEYRPEGFEKIRGAKLLLVEDNEINQQIAKEILEHEGFFVEIAENGLLGVEKVRKDGRFDLVLMDLQMPVMDGYEATAAIRKEYESNKLPIVAMTADAMTGVRDRVEKVGMNDYVTKPIIPGELWNALVEWIAPGLRELPEEFLQKTGASGIEVPIPFIEGLDMQNGLARIGGNRKLYSDLLLKFRADYMDGVAMIREALEMGDREAAVRLAHTIKGVAGNIGAKEVQKAAAEAEKTIKDELGNDDQIDNFDRILSAFIGNLNKADLDLNKDERKNSAKKETDKNELMELFSELDSVLGRRKPKPAKEIIEKIDGYKLPESLRREYENLNLSLGKYKFKEAQETLQNLTDQLNTD